jgi:hypothetical protein
VTFIANGLAQVQVITFGDSNTDIGFQGSDGAPRAASYVSSADPNIRLSPYAQNSSLQLAGKIEAAWGANRPQTIRVVNHGITGTTTMAGRTIEGAPNAQTVVGGFTRFQGEVLGLGFPWDGGEPRIVEGNINPKYPNGSILRINAFRPRSSDYAYISMGTNDVYLAGASSNAVKANLENLIQLWIDAGLPPSHLFVTTLPPLGQSGSSTIQALNTMIKGFTSKGVKIIDIAFFTTSGDGLHWANSTMHVGDYIHYSEPVRAWIADQVVSLMVANP